MNEIPPLWHSLTRILSKEKQLQFLPNDVSAVILKLIEIRTEMFRNSATRRNEDYVDYPWEEEGEVATQYYPNWEILRCPNPRLHVTKNIAIQRDSVLDCLLLAVGAVETSL